MFPVVLRLIRYTRLSLVLTMMVSNVLFFFASKFTYNIHFCYLVEIFVILYSQGSKKFCFRLNPQISLAQSHFEPLITESYCRHLTDIYEQVSPNAGHPYESIDLTSCLSTCRFFRLMFWFCRNLQCWEWLRLVHFILCLISFCHILIF